VASLVRMQGTRGDDRVIALARELEELDPAALEELLERFEERLRFLRKSRGISDSDKSLLTG
jgi:hypothetical protein